jgi:hypothetical protein
MSNVRRRLKRTRSSVTPNLAQHRLLSATWQSMLFTLLEKAWRNWIGGSWFGIGIQKFVFLLTRVNEERSAAVLNVLRRSAQGIASPEKAATSQYEAKTLNKGAR